MEANGTRDVEIQQFAKKVYHFSSQYGGETSISYTVTNLAGMCTKYPHYGDFTQACVFRTYGPWWKTAPSVTKPFPRVPDSFNSVDYVELYFSEAVVPKSIEIFETYNPGAVVRILAYVHLNMPSRCSSTLYDATWMTLWNGTPQRAPPQSRIFSPTLREIPYATNFIRLELNPLLCHYYTELDGVRLTGLTPRYRVPDVDLSLFSGPPPDYDTALREYGTPVDPFPMPGTTGYEDLNDNTTHNDAVHNNSNYLPDAPSCQCTHTPPPVPGMDALSDPSLCKSPGLTLTGATRTCSNAQSKTCSEGSTSVGKSCSEMLVNDLSRLHLTDGLSAALDPSDNGYFDLLPGEVIQGVLSYLDTVSLCRLSQTCRLLQQHCYDPLQYTELSLQPYWMRVNDDTLDGLHTRCRYVQRLSLSWCGGSTSITPTGLQRFLLACGSTLTTLHLACCRFMNDATLTVIVDHCPVLEDIDLQSNRTIVTGNGFREVCRMNHLRRLNLYRTFIDNTSITAIIRCSPDLEFLNLGSCGSMSEIDTVAIELSVYCKRLKHLDLWRARSLTEVGLRAIINNCPDMEELDVGWCPNLRSGTGIFVELAKGCPKLRKLFLTANRTICDADLEAFAHCCRDLEQLDILGTREVSPRVAKKILDNCKGLRLVDVSFCSAITADVVELWEQLYPKTAIKRSFQT